jgi:hypothetical protein
MRLASLRLPNSYDRQATLSRSALGRQNDYMRSLMWLYSGSQADRKRGFLWQPARYSSHQRTGARRRYRCPRRGYHARIPRIYCQLCVSTSSPPCANGNVLLQRQQAGRSGRRARDALAVLVVDSIIDEHFARHPNELYDTPTDDLLIDLDSRVIIEAHLQCAAQEMPVSLDDEVYFGPLTKELCETQLVKDAEGWSVSFCLSRS